ncbi:ATP-binding protein [Roseburia hominis]
MRKRIQKNLLMIVSLALLLSYLIMTVFIYRQTLLIMREELEQEAGYIQAAVMISGEEYLREMDDVQKDTRITQIGSDGRVLYDSVQDDATLENHSSRNEVQEAFKNGTGQDIRMSDTVGREMFYYAVLLPDGTVLRVSKGMSTVWHTAFRILPFMAGTGVFLAVISWILARLQVSRLIRPINALDLEHPLQTEVYEELSPLLERIDRQNKEKEKIEQMRREFSANVSHELKTPLTSISGYAEIMMNGLVKKEDVPQFSARIYHEASRMIALVGDIIKLSRLDEGSIELEKEEVDLYQLTREIVSRLALEAGKRGVRMEVVGEPVVIRGIRQILDEMIYNLCENAVKYNVENGTVSIWVGKTLSGSKVIVKDTGIGIPKEHIERIFERFYRVDKSHSRESGGTGLGLSIVKHGAILHGARIEVESDSGKGTKMELIFP